MSYSVPAGFTFESAEMRTPVLSQAGGPDAMASQIAEKRRVCFPTKFVVLKKMIHHFRFPPIDHGNEPEMATKPYRDEIESAQLGFPGRKHAAPHANVESY